MLREPLDGRAGFMGHGDLRLPHDKQIKMGPGRCHLHPFNSQSIAYAFRAVHRYCFRYQCDGDDLIVLTTRFCHLSSECESLNRDAFGIRGMSIDAAVCKKHNRPSFTLVCLVRVSLPS